MDHTETKDRVEEYYQAYLACVGDYTARHRLVRKYAWAIPTYAAVKHVTEYTNKVVEIGAGTGYWAMCLAAVGIEVKAFDIKPYKNLWCDGSWFQVEKGSPGAAANYRDHALFLCWPPYDDTLAVDALRSYSGNTLIYVGEGWGGCTGDDEFHDLLVKEWEELSSFRIPQYDGIHDYLHIYKRKDGHGNSSEQDR